MLGCLWAWSALVCSYKKVPLLQDAVYIDLAGSHAHVEEGPSKLVTSLMETQYPLDTKIKQASVTLLQVFICVFVLCGCVNGCVCCICVFVLSECVHGCVCVCIVHVCTYCKHIC